MKYLWHALLIASVFTSSSTFADKRTEAPPELAQWIQAQMDEYHITGASIAVIHNYKIKWAQGFGYRDKALKLPVTPDTLFQAASISKPVTAVAVMEIFKTRHLSLNENINQYLVSWKVPDNLYTVKQPVTMRLLLSHSAGISNFRYKGYSTKDELPTLLQSLNGMPPANTQPVTVANAPGVMYAYSPAGYTIIQQTLEDIEKKPFAKIMQKTILTPLKMTHSTFQEPLPTQFKKNIALAYLPNGKAMPDSPFIFIEAAAGGLWSTPSDLARFVIAIEKTLASNPQNGMSKKMIEDMLQSTVDHNMGLGFEVNIDNEGTQTNYQANYFRHGGFNSGYIAMFVGSEKLGNGVVIMANTAPYMTAKSVPQFDFITKIIKHISLSEGWR